MVLNKGSDTNQIMGLNDERTKRKKELRQLIYILYVVNEIIRLEKESELFFPILQLT